MFRKGIFLFGLLLLSPISVRADTNITWNPSHVSQTLLAGTGSAMEVRFTSSIELSNVSVRVVPELAPFVFVLPTAFQNIPSKEVRSLTIFFNIPKGTATGTILGTIHLVNANKTFALPLPVEIQVKAPTINEIPLTIALPSLDRIVTQVGAEGIPFVKDEIDIFFREGTSRTAINGVVIDIGGTFLGSIPAINYYQVQVSAEGFDNLSALIDRVRQNRNIEAAVYHLLFSTLLTPNDPGAKSSYAPGLINLPFAWDITTGSKTLPPIDGQNPQPLGIAVVDSLFDNTNADLMDNIIRPATNSACNILDPFCAFHNEHGTRVASIVGAKGDNSMGIAGVMWNASMRLYSAAPSYSLSCLFAGPLPLCDLLAGKLDPTLLVEALSHAIQDGSLILNFSSAVECATNTCTQQEKDFLQKADDTFKPLVTRTPNMLWVLGAGNNGVELSRSSPARLSATYANVVSVSAVDSARMLAQFGPGRSSDYGKNVTVAAPGVRIPSDRPGILSSVIGYDDVFNGTSASAPFVTGVAGLMLSVNPNLTAAQLKTIIHDTADLTANFDPEGNPVRILNALRAVQQARTPSVTISPPTVTLPPGGVQTFTATITGTSDTAVTWSMLEGAAGGTITSTGIYTAPNTACVFHVVATSKADSTKSAIATVTVAQGPGTFVCTGSMTTPRAEHTATLLPNGKVLVTGGTGGSPAGFLNSAESYDPGNGLFTATSSMSEIRGEGHTATLLSDGRVLVVGGQSSNVPTPTAELYDPNTGEFDPTGSMATPRLFHTATLLLNGKVLITGGLSANNFLESAELYEPSTGMFTPTGSMSSRRYAHTATLLASGKVLITGGGSDNPSISIFASAEIYDPATGIFAPTASMGTARLSHTAVLLPDGRVLIAGGGGLLAFSLSSAEIFDPTTGMFTITGSMSDARRFHTATLLPNGKVLVVGGGNGPGFSWLATAEIYQPSAGVFIGTGSMSNARFDHTATLLQNGTVLVAGGRGAIFTPTEVYLPGP